MPKETDQILIIGPDHPSDLILKAWNDAGVEYKTAETVGYGEQEKLELSTITETLEHASETTHLHYYIHGDMQDGIHQVYNNNPYIIPTQSMLAHDKDKPGIRQVWSCHSGGAKGDVEALG